MISAIAIAKPLCLKQSRGNIFYPKSMLWRVGKQRGRENLRPASHRASPDMSQAWIDAGHVCRRNGDYNFNRAPHIRCYVMLDTPSRIDKNVHVHFFQGVSCHADVIDVVVFCFICMWGREGGSDDSDDYNDEIVSGGVWERRSCCGGLLVMVVAMFVLIVLKMMMMMMMMMTTVLAVLVN